MRASKGLKSCIGTGLGLLLGCIPADQTGGASSSSSSGASSSSGSAASGLVALDADALCNRLIGECKQQALQTECINTFFPLRVTAACRDAIPSAACADLTSTKSAISTLCFPACTVGTAPVCNGDGTITTCTATGNTHKNDCRDSCSAIGFTSWTGSCGTTYDSQVATQPQCWCR